MKCIYCGSQCIKTGKSKETQRYQCKSCKRFQQSSYIKQRITEEKYKWVQKLNNEGCSISSISRLLDITKSSVQRIIEKIASNIKHPILHETMQDYEIDELYTYCGNKKNECWLIYAINKETGAVVDFCIGRRTKENTKKVVDAILKLNPRRIYTDKLNIYPTLIPENIHSIFKYSTNKIERNNLTLRNCIKRLSHKTICFNKSINMFRNCISIYFACSFQLKTSA